MQQIKGITCLSLFDGMSCGQIALNNLGIKVDNYYASEVDKYAMQIAKKNFPNITHIGDVTKVIGSELPKIDLLIGGSPCQGFSFAGKQLNFDDTRSALFFEFVRLLKECKPKYFMLENVRMKQEFQDVISEHLGVKPIMINSALVSAQNRVRLYWTNIPNVVQPDDMGIVLNDIIETGVVDRDKSFCIDANYFKGGNLKSYFEKHRRQLVFSKDGLCHVGDAAPRPCKLRNVDTNALCHHTATALDINGHELMKRVYAGTGKSPTLNACTGGNREPKILCGAWRGRYLIGGETEQRLEIREDGKTNTITTVQKDNVVTKGGVYYRKLTPIECERLQTVPDGYTEFLDVKEYYLYNNLETNKQEFLCNVKLKDAKESQKPTAWANYALSITKDLNDTAQQSCLQRHVAETKNVSFVIQRLEKKEVVLEGCVIDITKTGLDTKTLYIQIKSALELGQEGTKKELVVKTNTDLSLRIILVESSVEARLSIMLIAIKLIIALKIYMFVGHKVSIQFYIDSLSELRENLLSVELSSLKVEVTKLMVSNSQRYKMLGNGWTVEVIKHIFENMETI